eukprot:Skav226711  [mRNA]  locus=scaffold3811:159663:164088:+ [translate_table: standard]
MKRPAEDVADTQVPVNPETPFEHLGSGLDEQPAKRHASPCWSATSTPELGPSTSPEERPMGGHCGSSLATQSSITSPAKKSWSRCVPWDRARGETDCVGQRFEGRDGEDRVDHALGTASRPRGAKRNGWFLEVLAMCTGCLASEFGASVFEGRDHAHHSDLWQLPVKELKARLTALGTDLRGVTEKTELVMLLEELLG